MLDALLVTVTVASLGLAGAMGLVSWRVLRLDRRRSEARVASLREAASRMSAVGDEDAESTERQASWPQADLPGSVTSGAPPEMCAAQESDSRVRLIVAVAIVSVIFVAVAATILTPGSRGTRADAETSSAPKTQRAAAPLELLFLDHARDGLHLDIRGLVRNPASAPTMRDIEAVAYLFDQDGGQLGVSRARVVEPVLAPGAASRFEIPVPDAQGVGRYRVTFQVGFTNVPHVDRRTASGAQALPASRVAVAARDRDGSTPASAVR